MKGQRPQPAVAALTHCGHTVQPRSAQSPRPGAGQGQSLVRAGSQEGYGEIKQDMVGSQLGQDRIKQSWAGSQESHGGIY